MRWNRGVKVFGHEPRFCNSKFDATHKDLFFGDHLSEGDCYFLLAINVLMSKFAADNFYKTNRRPHCPAAHTLGTNVLGIPYR